MINTLEQQEKDLLKEIKNKPFEERTNHEELFLIRLQIRNRFRKAKLENTHDLQRLESDVRFHIQKILNEKKTKS